MGTDKYMGYGEHTVIFHKKSMDSDDSLVDPESTKKERHLSYCRELNDLYRKKNHDYGDSFHKTFVEEGFATARIKLGEKLERFKTLSRGVQQQVKDESIRDTLIDLANYALMTILELDETKDRKVEEHKEDTTL